MVVFLVCVEVKQAPDLVEAAAAGGSHRPFGHGCARRPGTRPELLDL